MRKSKALELSSVKIDSLIAICSDGVHRFWHGAGERDSIADMQLRHDYEKSIGHKAQTSILSGVCADYDCDKCFVFYVADSFDPSTYLVWGNNESDAYETFVNEFEHLVKIDDDFLKDYGIEQVKFNDNGTAIDDESVQWISVASLVLTVKQ